MSCLKGIHHVTYMFRDECYYYVTATMVNNMENINYAQNIISGHITHSNIKFPPRVFEACGKTGEIELLEG